MDAQTIVKHIARLKGLHRKVYTNCQMQFLHTGPKEWNTMCTEESLCMKYCENGVNRIWFYTVNFEDMGRILRGGGFFKS